MKTKLFISVICVVALLLSTSTPAFAQGDTDPTSVVVDVAVARPLTLGMTIVGTALFVVSLPFAAASGTVEKTAKTLVAAPAKDTFKRPVGDLADFLDY